MTSKMWFFGSRSNVLDEGDELDEGEYVGILDFVPFRDIPDPDAPVLVPQDISANANANQNPTAGPEKKLKLQHESTRLCPSWCTVLIILICFAGTALAVLHALKQVAFESSGSGLSFEGEPQPPVSPPIVIVAHPEPVATEPGPEPPIIPEPESEPQPKRPAWPIDGVFDLVDQYPALKSNSTSKCRTAWNMLKPLPCSTAIFWMRTWDEGDWSDRTAAQINYLVPRLCQGPCWSALREAAVAIGEACNEADIFELRGYEGKFYEDSSEAGPSSELNVFLKRYDRTCRTSPIGDAERGFCMTDLSARWHIVDGTRTLDYVTLDNLRNWMFKTNSKRVEPATTYKGQPGSWEKDIEYSREERSFGPGQGETTCSWCTVEWFGEKMQNWNSRVQADGHPMELYEYLRTWKKAGRRCAGDHFEQVYQAAVKTYQDRGLLHEGWEQQPTTKLLSLIQFGPGDGDFPLPQLSRRIQEMKDPKINTTETSARVDGSEWSSQTLSCLEGYKSAAEDLQCWPFFDFPYVEEHILSDWGTTRLACESRCVESVHRFQQAVEAACPKWKHTNQSSEKTTSAITPREVPSAPFVGQISNVANYNAICADAAGRASYMDKPCPFWYNAWGVASWTLQKPSPKELVKTTRRVLSAAMDIIEPIAQPEPIDLPDDMYPGEVLVLPPEPIDVYPGDWARNNGVCTGCHWRKYAADVAGPGDWGYMPPDKKQPLPDLYTAVNLTGADEDVAMEFIKTAHLLRMRCGELNQRLWRSTIEIVAVDEKWKSLYSQELWDEAFISDRPDPEWLKE
ncbi:hypothetical protein VTL71DRAFT_14080 [Oculimacula yallundae]|uniref:Uncharacterized protein n=1 Tax=Oculimacula yallundae TaxID=86028 RepID=A0ABR4CHG0_9HELO